MKGLALLLSLVVVPTCGIGGCIVVVAVASGGVPASASAAASDDIPSELVPVYEAAAASCGMPWAVLAAVGKVESDHARSQLPGVHAGANEAGAEGPMQFEPATWATYGLDANHDGRVDVYDPVDAIWGAARMLCANGATNASTLAAAVFSYNHSDEYVIEVLAVARSYAQPWLIAGTTDHVLPISAALLEPHPEWLRAPHHDYPAIDIPVPVGTPVFATTTGTITTATGDDGRLCGGTVVLAGDDGATYTYCHLSAVAVTVDQRVAPGHAVGSSGGAPGAYGAGDSSGPHLHYGIALGGQRLCPQPILIAWSHGQDVDLGSASSTGCFY